MAVVRNPLAGVEFVEARLDFGKKHKALDRVIHCGLRRHLAERFDDPITTQWFRHVRILRDAANVGRASRCTADRLGSSGPTNCQRCNR